MASSRFVDPPDELRACSEAFHAEAMKHLDAVFEEQSYSTCLSYFPSQRLFQPFIAIYLMYATVVIYFAGDFTLYQSTSSAKRFASEYADPKSASKQSFSWYGTPSSIPKKDPSGSWSVSPPGPAST